MKHGPNYQPNSYYSSEYVYDEGDREKRVYLYERWRTMYSTRGYFQCETAPGGYGTIMQWVPRYEGILPPPTVSYTPPKSRAAQAAEEIRRVIRSSRAASDDIKRRYGYL